MTTGVLTSVNGRCIKMATYIKVADDISIKDLSLFYNKHKFMFNGVFFKFENNFKKGYTKQQKEAAIKRMSDDEFIRFP